MRKLLAFLALLALLVAPERALAGGEGSVENDGQALIVHFARPVAMYFGEAGGATSDALYPGNYALDGVPLGDASPSCIASHVATYTFCDTTRVLLSDHALVEGRQYTVAFEDQDLGTFIAHGLADRTPPVVLGVDVGQAAIVVRFDRPMRHDGDCPGWSGAAPGSVGFVRGDLPTFSSPDEALEDALATWLSAFMNDDCSAVTLTVGNVFPEGRFRLDVANLQDASGNVLAPVRFDIDIPDLGAPSLESSYGAVQDGAWELDLRFDQPLDRNAALDPASFSIDGRPLPSDAMLTCSEACSTVHIAFALSSVDAAIHFHELTYEGVRDPAGNAPDPLETVYFPAH